MEDLYIILNKYFFLISFHELSKKSKFLSDLVVNIALELGIS